MGLWIELDFPVNPVPHLMEVFQGDAGDEVVNELVGISHQKQLARCKSLQKSPLVRIGVLNLVADNQTPSGRNKLV